MPTYDVSAPNGKTYRVTTPPGATRDDAIDHVIDMWPESRTPPPSALGWVKANVGPVVGGLGRLADEDSGHSISGLLAGINPVVGAVNAFGPSTGAAKAAEDLGARWSAEGAGRWTPELQDIPGPESGWEVVPYIGKLGMSMLETGSRSALPVVAAVGLAAAAKRPDLAAALMLGTSTASSYGDIRATQDREGIDAPLLALGTAAGIGAIDAFTGVGKAGRGLISSLTRQGLEQGQRKYGRELAKTAFSEGAIEGGVQTPAERWAGGASLTSREALYEYLNAFGGGFAMGSVAGAAHEGVNVYKDRQLRNTVAQMEPLDRVEVDIPDTKEPTQYTRDTFDIITMPDSEGVVFARRANGDVIRVPLEELEAARPQEGKFYPSEAFTRAATDARLEAVAGVEERRTTGVTDQLRKLKTNVADAFATENPQKLADYITKQETRLGSSAMSEQELARTSTIVAEAKALLGEYEAARAANAAPPVAEPAEAAEPAPKKRRGRPKAEPAQPAQPVPVPRETLTTRVVRKQIEELQDQQTRADILQTVADDPAAVNKPEKFADELTARGLEPPTPHEATALRNAMRMEAELDAPLAAQEVEQVNALRRKLVERFDIIEDTLKAEGSLAAGLKRANAKLKRAGQPPVAPEELERVYGIPADEFRKVAGPQPVEEASATQPTEEALSPEEAHAAAVQAQADAARAQQEAPRTSKTQIRAKRPIKRLEDADWTKTTEPDGSVVYTKETVAPALSPEQAYAAAANAQAGVAPTQETPDARPVGRRVKPSIPSAGRPAGDVGAAGVAGPAGPGRMDLVGGAVEQSDGGAAGGERALKAVADDLRLQLNRMGLRGVELEVAPHMAGAVAGGFRLEGSTAVIGVVLDSPDGVTFTLNHEALHALRALGVITEQQWPVLVAAAKRQPGLMDDIAKRYGDNTVEEQEEEAVADLFAMYQSGELRPKGAVQKIFERIQKFLMALRNALRGQGFTTPQSFEDVFAGLANGEAAAAALSGRPLSATEKESRTRTAPLQAAAAAADSFIPPPPPGSPESWFTGTPEYPKLSRVAAVLQALRYLPNTLSRAFNDQFTDAVRIYKRQILNAFGVREADVADSLDLKLAFRLFKSSLSGRQVLLDRNYFRPIMEAVKADKLEWQDVGMYFLARGAKDRNRIIAERTSGEIVDGSGMSDAEAAAILVELRLRGLEPALRKLAKKHDRLVDFLLAERVKYGLMTQDDATTLRAAQPFYTPYRGFSEYGDMLSEDIDSPEAHTELIKAQTARAEQGGGVSAREYLTAGGRDPSRMPFHPIFTLFADAQSVIVKTQQNEVGKTLLNLIRAAPAAMEDIAKYAAYGEGQNPPVTYVPTHETGGGEWRVIEEPAMKEMMEKGLAMRVKENGQSRYIQFAPTENGRWMHRSFSNLTPEEMKITLRMVTAMNAYIKSSTTRWSPSYVLLTAPLRDMADSYFTAMAMENDKNSPVFGKPFARKVRQHMFSAENFFAIPRFLRGVNSTNPEHAEVDLLVQQFIEDGGSVSHAMFYEVERHADETATEFKRLKRLENGNPLTWSAEFVRVLGKHLDMATQWGDLVGRFATYRAALELGVSRKRAAALALDSSLDLTKRGEASWITDNTLPFFSATVESARKNIQMGLLTPRVAARVMSKAVAIGAAAAFANALIGAFYGDDDDGDGEPNYKDIPAYRQNNMLNLYYGGGGDDYVSIPMGFQVLVPKILGEVLAETMLDMRSGRSASVALLDSLERLTWGVVGAYSPLKIVGEGAVQKVDLEGFLASLVGLGPVNAFAELAINRNFFGSEIYTQAHSSSDVESELGRPSTATLWVEFAKWLNRVGGGSPSRNSGLDVQPEKIEYFFTDMMGGSYRFIEDVAKAPTDISEKGIRGVPILKQLVGRGSDFTPYSKYKAFTDDLGNLAATRRKALTANDPYEQAEAYAKWQEDVRLQPPIMTDPVILEMYEDAESRLRKIAREQTKLMQVAGDDWRARKRVAALTRTERDQVYLWFNRFYILRRALHEEGALE